MNNTKIPWTEKTWNPVVGCSKYSAGCAHCYAEGITRRFPDAFPNGFNVTLHPERLDEPKKVKKPTMFFVCSMGDLFHPDVPFEFVSDVFRTMKQCEHHTFQVLTKRTERMWAYIGKFMDATQNIWIGTTVESIDTVGRIKTLQEIKNYGLSNQIKVKFLSCEPLLSDLGVVDLSGIDWVIVGGESGNQARPMKKEWVLNIKRQCDEQGVPFFFKQWGTYGEDGVKRNAKANGCTIDGQIYKEWPKAWSEINKIKNKHGKEINN